MGKITKNYVYNLIYQVVVMIVPLVTAPYLARVLGAESMGVYSYVNSIASIICTIVLLGVYNYGNRQIAYVRDSREKTTAVFWQIMSFRMVVVVIGTVVYAITVLLIGKFKVLFLLYYTYLLANFIDPTWLFVGVEDMKWALIKNLTTKIIALVGVFAFIKNESDLKIFVLLQGLSILISNLLSFTQLRRYISKPYIDFSNFKNDVVGSFFLFLPMVGMTIYTQCDKIMIEIMTGETSSISYYDYSEKIIAIPLAFVITISTVFMPRLANEFKKGNKQNIEQLLSNSLAFSLMMATPMSMGLMAIADKFVPWYLGAEFESTVLAIKLLAPTIIVNAFSGLAGRQYLTATNQTTILTISQFSAVFINVLLNWILIPYYDFRGAAIATFFTTVTCAGIQFFVVVRQVKIHGIIRCFLKYLLSSILMYLCIRAFSFGMDSNPITTLCQMAIGIMVYFIALLIFKDETFMFCANKCLSFIGINNKNNL